MTGIAPNSKAATCCQNSSYLKGIVLLIYDWLKILGKHSYCDRKTHQWENTVRAIFEKFMLWIIQFISLSKICCWTWIQTKSYHSGMNFWVCFKLFPILHFILGSCKISTLEEQGKRKRKRQTCIISVIFAIWASETWRPLSTRRLVS